MLATEGSESVTLPVRDSNPPFSGIISALLPSLHGHAFVRAAVVLSHVRSLRRVCRQALLKMQGGVVRPRRYSDPDSDPDLPREVYFLSSTQTFLDGL